MIFLKTILYRDLMTSFCDLKNQVMVINYCYIENVAICLIIK